MKAEFKVKRQILLDLVDEQGFDLDGTDLATEEGVAEAWEDCGPDYGEWFNHYFGGYEDEEIPASLGVEEYHCSRDYARLLPDGSWIRYSEMLPTNDLDIDDLDLSFEDYDVKALTMQEEVVTVKVFEVEYES